MSIEEMAAIMHAEQEGKPIEVRFKANPNAKWMPRKKRVWDWCGYEYRVSPNPAPPRRKPREWVMTEDPTCPGRWLAYLSDTRLFKGAWIRVREVPEGQ